MNIIVRAFFIAVTFVGWAVMSKYCRQNFAWSASIVFFFTAVPVLILSRATLLSIPVPDIKSFLILSVAGALNGFGVYFYSQTLERAGNQSGAFIVTVSVVMVMVAPLLAYFVNGEVINLKQTAGLVCAISAVYLLS